VPRIWRHYDGWHTYEAECCRSVRRDLTLNFARLFACGVEKRSVFIPEVVTHAAA
jgi:hypothetical protein